MFRKISISVAFSVALAACRSAGGCPPIVAYSLEDQKIAAKQLRALPKNTPLAAMIVDYKKTRDACRASGS
ncbi:MAG: hypothetical protein FJX16_10710 [Alphaproteobacteria bacterium]|nr:hypothetical protein [Alphaproteobacteria bacterium]MBM3625769.1 hypothetical protein [Alphaproteobacteria bacterium]